MLEAVACYRDYMANFNKKGQKGKLNEKASKKAQHKKPAAESDKVAEKPQRYKLSQEGLSGRGPKLGRKVHGIREGAGEYDPVEGTSGNGEDSTRPIDSTRYLETAQGVKTYFEVAEIIAVSVTKTIEAVVEQTPEDIRITLEGICKLHHNIAFELFPDWAGHFRAINVKVGTHTPPPLFPNSDLVNRNFIN